MKKQIAWVSSLFVINVCVAFVVIYSKHATRNYHIELSQLAAIEDDLDTEWGKLQLEEGALAEYGRIDRIAKDRLNMRVPETKKIRFVLE